MKKQRNRVRGGKKNENKNTGNLKIENQIKNKK